VRQPFEAQVAKCRANNGDLLTNNDQVLSRWNEHFDRHLNEGVRAGGSRTNLVDLRDIGIEIDLPSRVEIERATKYSKNNKAASSDSIAGKIGSPKMVDVLYEMIKLAWIVETRGMVQTIEESVCLTWHTRYSKKYDSFLPCANAFVQYYKTGF
jgi:hypothetical protein